MSRQSHFYLCVPAVCCKLKKKKKPQVDSVMKFINANGHINEIHYFYTNIMVLPYAKRVIAVLKFPCSEMVFLNIWVKKEKS